MVQVGPADSGGRRSCRRRSLRKSTTRRRRRSRRRKGNRRRRRCTRNGARSSRRRRGRSIKRRRGSWVNPGGPAAPAVQGGPAVRWVQGGLGAREDQVGPGDRGDRAAPWAQEGLEAWGDLGVLPGRGALVVPVGGLRKARGLGSPAAQVQRGDRWVLEAPSAPVDLAGREARSLKGKLPARPVALEASTALVDWEVQAGQADLTAHLESTRQASHRAPLEAPMAQGGRSGRVASGVLVGPAASVARQTNIPPLRLVNREGRMDLVGRMGQVGRKDPVGRRQRTRARRGSRWHLGSRVGQEVLTDRLDRMGQAAWAARAALVATTGRVGSTAPAAPGASVDLHTTRLRTSSQAARPACMSDSAGKCAAQAGRGGPAARAALWALVGLEDPAGLAAPAGQGAKTASGDRHQRWTTAAPRACAVVCLGPGVRGGSRDRVGWADPEDLQESGGRGDQAARAAQAGPTAHRRERRKPPFYHRANCTGLGGRWVRAARAAPAAQAGPMARAAP